MNCVVLKRLAAYNAWANDLIYSACAELTSEELKRGMGASFSSIHGTLNHLLLADRIWLARFHNEIPSVTSLHDEVCADFAGLRRERQVTDQDLQAWVANLTDDMMDATLIFTTIARPQQISMLLGVAALHAFNHQTYHRGQVASLIRQLGYAPPSTDLLYMDLLSPAK